MLYDLKDWLNQMYKGSNPLGHQVPPQGHVRGLIRVDSPIMMRLMKDEYEEAFRAETGGAEWASTSTPPGHKKVSARSLQ